MTMRWLGMLVCIVAGCSDGNHGGGGGGSGGFGGGGGGTQLKPTIGLDLAHIVGFAVGAGGAASRLAPEALPEELDGGTTTSRMQLYAIDDQGNLVTTTIVTTSD